MYGCFFYTFGGGLLILLLLFFVRGLLIQGLFVLLYRLYRICQPRHRLRLRCPKTRCFCSLSVYKLFGPTQLLFEDVGDKSSAIKREKQIKGWRREKKVKLIDSINPDWEDLSRDWYD